MMFDQVAQQLTTLDTAATRSELVVGCRALLKQLIEGIYQHRQVAVPKQATLLEMMEQPLVSEFVNDADVVQAMHYVRILGMNAEHGAKIRKREAELAQENIVAAVELVQLRVKDPAAQYVKPPYMSEANTRKLYIDLYLREAGWEVLETEGVALPAKAGVEIEVQGMPNASGIGRCDYVLYGRDGKPLAVVEAKKTSISPEKGRHQVDLYGECFKAVYGYKPVLYYTNGYTTKVIDGVYPDRTVIAFHTLEELERMIQRRARKDITDLKINDEISGRPYQKIAITSLCEKLNKKQRRGLLVMATGTGKTRVSISLVDVLMRNQWVKNVLFLADRTSLVSQAKRNFSKLLPNCSICVLSEGGEKDFNARLMFSTYQTMINYIDAEDKRFKSGRFDLIIVDEAHRSIFNRYGAIFSYFDSLLVGLTATPKDEVDANTYGIFSCESGVPDSEYSLEEAIKEHYLVGYKVINRSSQMLENGINISRLSVEEQTQLEEYLAEVRPPSLDYTVPGNELFKSLYNEKTCKLVVEELMTQGLRVNQGETLGKSIIFAFDHTHAQMIVECFHELYPELPANTCQLVDNYVQNAQSLIENFEEDPIFRVAVSVDMLDTGIDVPEVLNLVFFKKVRSKIKFVQMIGRGTRLCEHLYGPGKHKNGFLIFDYCGNFEYFDEHEQGAEAQVKTLGPTQRLFILQSEILHELQQVQYQEDVWSKGYYDELKARLHQQVTEIRAHSNRIQVRAEMQYVDKYCDWESWMALTPVSVQELQKHIVPILDTGVAGNPTALAFDCCMMKIMLSFISTGSVSGAAREVKQVSQAAKYLLDEKASIPQVLAKVADLKQLASSDFWEYPVMSDIERLRKSLRELMQFLGGDGRGKYEINLPDVITQSEFQPDDTVVDIRTYREKVIDYLAAHLESPAIRKIHNLESITTEDLEELERILWQELGSKEEYDKTTDQTNLVVFVRSLIGLNQEAVNEKFSIYLNDNTFNAQQQEYIRTIINYVRANGDIELKDIVNKAPFNNYNIADLFGAHIATLRKIIEQLHDPVIVAAS
jgi:type I restriction enzyme R subunit